jgi:hypothetical protein
MKGTALAVADLGVPIPASRSGGLDARFAAASSFRCWAFFAAAVRAAAIRAARRRCALTRACRARAAAARRLAASWDGEGPAGTTATGGGGATG